MEATLANFDQETLDAAGLARIIPLSEKTIRADVSRRPWLLPPFVKVGTRTVWLRQTVLDWLKQRECTATLPSPPLAQTATAHPPSRRRGRPTKAEEVAARTGNASRSA